MSSDLYKSCGGTCRNLCVLLSVTVVVSVFPISFVSACLILSVIMTFRLLCSSENERERVFHNLRILPFGKMWALLWGASVFSLVATFIEYYGSDVRMWGKAVLSLKFSFIFLLFYCFYDFNPRRLKITGWLLFSTVMLTAFLFIISAHLYPGLHKAHYNISVDYRIFPEVYFTGKRLKLCGVNQFSFITATVLIYLLSFLTYAGQKIPVKAGLVAACAALVYVLVITGSRTSLLAVLLVGFILLWRSRFRVLAVALPVLAIAAAPYLGTRYDYDRAVRQGYYGRLGYLERAWKCIVRRPLTGWGMRKRKDAEKSAPGAIYKAHNTVVNMALRRGVVAALAQTVVLVGLFVSLWRREGAVDRASPIAPWVTGTYLCSYLILLISVAISFWFKSWYGIIAFAQLAFVSRLEVDQALLSGTTEENAV